MTPAMQTVLQDDRLLLRPMTSADHDVLFAVASDREIWAIHPAHDRWQALVFRAFFDERLASGGALVAIDRSTGDAIGSSCYDTINAGNGEVEIGWTYLARAYWGGVWNRSMKRLMLEHAFTRFETAIFLVGTDNMRSRRAMEKIGGRLTERRLTVMRGGQPIEHLIYAITREEFAQGPLSHLP